MRTAFICLTLLGLQNRVQEPTFPTVSETAPTDDRGRLEADVYRLADPSMGGRAGAGGRAAAQLIVERFQDLELEPAFGDNYVQAFSYRGRFGGNIAARLSGSPLKDDQEVEWVIVSAHYDHLGFLGGELYPGADDNATGVAMVLEIARAARSFQIPQNRGILFILFDLEEQGLIGSRAFVENPPVPLDQIGLMITADMLGRSLAGICQHDLFVMGTEQSPAWRPTIQAAAQDLVVRTRLIGADLLPVPRSDYGPFRARQIPFLFFSTGENPAYHTPEDIPETINYETLRGATELIRRVVVESLTTERLPIWQVDPEPCSDELEAIRDVLDAFLGHPDEVPLSRFHRLLAERTKERIESKLKDGSPINADFRGGILRTAAILLDAATQSQRSK